MNARSPWFYGLLALSVFSAGCSDDDAKQSGGAVSQKIDACTIVTQQDATTLFGQMASSEPPDITGGLILGQCHWTWDTDTENQLLQFYVWEGPEGYSTPSDSQPFAIGEKGNVRVVPGGGSQGLIDTMWIQDANTVSLGYSAIGSSYVPLTQAKIDAVKALALSASSKLAAK
jgi:hypothetical protein